MSDEKPGNRAETEENFSSVVCEIANGEVKFNIHPNVLSIKVAKFLNLDPNFFSRILQENQVDLSKLDKVRFDIKNSMSGEYPQLSENIERKLKDIEELFNSNT